MGKVYVLSQSRRVDLPKMPALGYWEAWMWVSGGWLVGARRRLGGEGSR